MGVMTKCCLSGALRPWRCLSLFLFFLAGTEVALPGQDKATVVSVAPAGPTFSLPGFTSGPVVHQHAEQVSLQTGVNAAWLKEYGLLSYRNVQRSREIVAEVFEMLDPAGAYGLFTQLSAPPKNTGNLGDGSSIGEEVVTFWKGNYFFRVRGGTSGDRESIAGRLAAQLPYSGQVPIVVELLPKAGLDPTTIRFYIGELLPSDGKLSDIYSKLGLEKSVQAAVGRYGERGERLIILGYPTQALALQSFQRIKDYVEDKSHLMYARRAGVILALTELMPRDEAVVLLEKIRYTPTIKWIVDKQKNPRRAGGGVRFLLNTVVGSLALSALFVGGTALLGAGFGLARFYMRRLNPNNFLDRPDRTQMVRLKLVDR